MGRYRDDEFTCGRHGEDSAASEDGLLRWAPAAPVGNSVTQLSRAATDHQNARPR